MFPKNHVQALLDDNNKSYNVLVNGGSNYINKAGMYIGNDTSTPTSGKYGINISQDLSGGNAFIESRSLSNNQGTLNFRYIDDSTRNVSTMLSLRNDNKSNDNYYGANVTGRMRSSQLVINEVDNRIPANPGVYINNDSNTLT